MVLAMFSPQNIDRLVTIYRACLRSGRDLVIDLYTAAIARGDRAGHDPEFRLGPVRVYLPDAEGPDHA